MDTPKPHPDKNLPANSVKHVRYEIHMLILTIMAQQRRWAGPDVIFRRNLLIESFVVHARNLDEFFKGHKKADRIKMSDFGLKGQKILGGASLARMNAEICHLGYNRKSEGEPAGWNLAEIAAPLRPHCEAFLKHVSELPALTKEEQDRCTSVRGELGAINWNWKP